jgi:glycosyltransferase involved in cell wall biosynthesis
MKKATKKFFLYQRLLPHYRVPIYEKINNALKDELLVIYDTPPSQTAFIEQNEGLTFSTFKLKNFLLLGGKLFWQSFYQPIKAKGKPKAILIEANPRILSLYFLYIYCKLTHTSFIPWGHGGSRARDIASGNYRDTINRWLVNVSDAYICYSDGIKASLSRITSPEKLFVARNTLDSDALIHVRKELELKTPENLKKEMGLEASHYLCFIGRLLPDKQIDVFLKVLGKLQQEGVNIGGIIMGDGPERHSLESLVKTENINQVHFLGNVPDWETSGKYLYISDAMLMPGYVGLSVNHALCYGVPVVTQTTGENGPYHSPEVEFIIEGETGFICQNGSLQHMAAAVKQILTNRQTFREKTKTYFDTKLSVNNMVQAVVDALKYTHTL